MQRTSAAASIFAGVLLVLVAETGALSPAPFLRIDDVLYLSTGDKVMAIAPDDLGPVIGRVACGPDLRRTIPGCGRSIIQAGALAADTPIYALKRYRTATRVAAGCWVPQHCRVELFDAFENPKARQGADLIDVDAGVARFEIQQVDAVGRSTQPSLVIDDDVRVSQIVSMIRSAPVVPLPSGEFEEKTLRDERGRPFYFTITVHFVDGTRRRIAFWPASGELEPKIAMPSRFWTMLVDAFKAADLKIPALERRTW